MILRNTNSTGEQNLNGKPESTLSMSNIRNLAIPDISVVVPVYDEGKSIGIILRMLSEIDWYPYNAEVIVVDDGSTDNSPQEIMAFPTFTYIRHKKNMGKGAALKTGFHYAKGKVMVIQDADLEYSPEAIPELVKPILFGSADVVFGSRFAGKCKGMSLSHFMGNKLLSITARMLFDAPITDIMTGSKAFSRAVVNSFELEQNGFEVEVEMTSKCLHNGWRFQEVPIGYSYRTFGSSKIGFLDGVKSMVQLFSRSYKDTIHE
jgi:glycosyltransferase involved in cell wall biosynthesis